MSKFKTIDDLSVAGQRVLVRVDFNVPMKDGKVTDATRLVRGAHTLAELAAKGARVVVMSHFGRPKNGPDASLSLRPLVQPLRDALGTVDVSFAEDCIGAVAEDAVAALGDGQVVLLENLRFHAGEEQNDPAFIDQLAKLGDLYINDAFSCAHRAHASTEGLATRLPAAAGRLMQEELEALDRALGHGEARGTIAMVGGAKVSTKLAILENLVTRVDALVIGGAMANTFLFADGLEVGKSLCERDMAETARAIQDQARRSGCSLVLPVDVVVADSLTAGAATETVPVTMVPSDKMILDIGPATVSSAAAWFDRAKVLVWNGPAGAFEIPPFDNGTVALAKAAANRCVAGRLVAVAGGGDTVAALSHARVAEAFTYVSSAGGAFLEWLEGRELPGVAALIRAA